MAVYYNTYSCSDDEETSEETGLSLEEYMAIAEKVYYWELVFFEDLSHYYPSFDLYPPGTAFVSTLKRPPYMFSRCNPMFLFTNLLQTNSIQTLRKFIKEAKGVKLSKKIRSSLTTSQIYNLQDRVEFSNMTLCDFDFLFYYAYKWNNYHGNYRREDSNKIILYVDCYIVSLLIGYLQRDKSLNFSKVLRRNRRNVQRSIRTMTHLALS